MSQTDYSAIAGGDSPPDARTLMFRGISGVECEHFIRSVRLIALAENKEEDDRWMLHFATARLAGRAMRWHAKLEKEIRKDWDLFVQALLDEYSLGYEEEPTAEAVTVQLAPSRASSPQPDPSSISPSRNLTPGLLIGRIRVIPIVGASHQFYLSKAVKLTAHKADALHVQVRGYGGPKTISTMNFDIPPEGRIIYPRLCVVRDGSVGWSGQVTYAHNYQSSNALLKSWYLGPDGTIEVAATSGVREFRSQTVVVSLCLNYVGFVESYDTALENSPTNDCYEATLVLELL